MPITQRMLQLLWQSGRRQDDRKQSSEPPVAKQALPWSGWVRPLVDMALLAKSWSVLPKGPC